MSTIENHPFTELAIGDSARLVRTLTDIDIKLFAIVSGDVNPAHVDPDYAKTDFFHKIIAHGMWGGALISTVLGTMLPGPGTIYLGQSLRFLKPVGIGDTVVVTVAITELHPKNHRVKLDCHVVNQWGEVVITGIAEVLAPTDKVLRTRIEMPEVILQEKHALDERQPPVGGPPQSEAGSGSPVV